MAKTDSVLRKKLIAAGGKTHSTWRKNLTVTLPDERDRSDKFCGIGPAVSSMADYSGHDVSMSPKTVDVGTCNCRRGNARFFQTAHNESFM